MKIFDEYFVFSSSEKRGIYLFMLIIFVLCLVYWSMPYLLKPSPTDFSEIIAKLEATENKQNTEETINTLFYFNPNTISKDSLELLGFTSKQAWNTVNFRKKVKPFSIKKDLQKLYAMTDSLY
jgi:competence protein ComEA